MSYIVVPTYRVKCDGCTTTIPELPLDDYELTSSWPDPEARLLYSFHYKNWKSSNRGNDVAADPGAMHLCGLCVYKLRQFCEEITGFEL